MVKVKICGITNLEDALVSINAGCDALGFGFFKASPRYITAAEASAIIHKLPKKVIKIGVFVDGSEKVIKETAKLCSLDILQFHGKESPEFCQKFKGYKIIKAFRVNKRLDLKKIKSYKTFAYLFDTFVASKPGGTGKTFKWEILDLLDVVKQPIFLSGGLSLSNVRRAIRVAHPDWVDVCSSIEIRAGKKDHKKVKQFIKAAKASG